MANHEFKLGIERLLNDSEAQKALRGQRLAFLGHPASVTQSLASSLDLLSAHPDFNIVAAFGPQHGMRGDKQDNMIESDDYLDPKLQIPVYSLYGKVRRPSAEMMQGWDVLLIDLQDVGCRIYTFLTTLFYVLEAAEKTGQAVWVLDRPNPAGRDIEGHTLDMKFESFVGAAPLPMRHGLTLGEAALWYKAHKKLNVDLRVLAMSGYSPSEGPGYGWPEMMWVNPSPNMPRLATARIYCGTVLFEGTNLSEGRGTTVPLEVFGAPKLEIEKILAEMRAMAPQWLRGCVLRPTYYEPTFHKFKGELVSGLQIHVDGPVYKPNLFKPYRLCTLFLKATQRIHPHVELWRKPPYEYEEKLLPIDILTGHGALRKWVADSEAKVSEWEDSLSADESAWQQQSSEFWLYK